MVGTRCSCRWKRMPRSHSWIAMTHRADPGSRNRIKPRLGTRFLISHRTTVRARGRGGHHPRGGPVMVGLHTGPPAGPPTGPPAGPGVLRADRSRLGDGPPLATTQDRRVFINRHVTSWMGLVRLPRRTGQVARSLDFPQQMGARQRRFTGFPCRSERFSCRPTASGPCQSRVGRDCVAPGT